MPHLVSGHSRLQRETKRKYVDGAAHGVTVPLYWPSCVMPRRYQLEVSCSLPSASTDSGVADHSALSAFEAEADMAGAAHPGSHRKLVRRRGDRHGRPPVRTGGDR